MADQEAAPVAAVEQEAQTPTPEQAQPDATGEKAERTFTKAEVEAMVRDRLASAQRKAEEAANKARTEAERKAAEEQGEYKKLADSLKAELEAERQARKAAELAGLRRDTAAKYSLPAALADRLRGETADELDADAQELLKSLPKPAAPNINAGDAPGQPAKLPGGMTEASIREQATRLGVGFEAFKAALLNGK